MYRLSRVDRCVSSTLLTTTGEGRRGTALAFSRLWCPVQAVCWMYWITVVEERIFGMTGSMHVDDELTTLIIVLSYP